MDIYKKNIAKYVYIVLLSCILWSCNQGKKGYGQRSALHDHGDIALLPAYDFKNRNISTVADSVETSIPKDEIAAFIIDMLISHSGISPDDEISGTPSAKLNELELLLDDTLMVIARRDNHRRIEDLCFSSMATWHTIRYRRSADDSCMVFTNHVCPPPVDPDYLDEIMFRPDSIDASDGGVFAALTAYIKDDTLKEVRRIVQCQKSENSSLGIDRAMPVRNIVDKDDAFFSSKNDYRYYVDSIVRYCSVPLTTSSVDSLVKVTLESAVSNLWEFHCDRSATDTLDVAAIDTITAVFSNSLGDNCLRFPNYIKYSSVHKSVIPKEIPLLDSKDPDYNGDSFIEQIRAKENTQGQSRSYYRAVLTFYVSNRTIYKIKAIYCIPVGVKKALDKRRITGRRRIYNSITDKC